MRLISRRLCTHSNPEKVKDGDRLSLGSAAQWLSGGTPNTNEASYWNGRIPWISAISLKLPWIDASDRNVTELGARNGTRLVPENTVIFVVRGSSLDSEFRIGLTQREVAFGQDCKALIPAHGIDPAVLFLAIRTRRAEILGLVDHTGHGAGRLATDLITRLVIRVPENARSSEVSSRFRYLMKLGASKHRENRTLVELRDTLLPGLISGELRIRDAEEVVEDAV